VLDLRKLIAELVATGCYRDEDETAKDEAVIAAIDRRDQSPSDRNRTVVNWLNHYKVLMSFSGEERIKVADQILGFADEREVQLVGLDKQTIYSEFEKLEKRIRNVAPRNKAGEPRDVTSLASKGLWCCYPNHVPIYDRNAVTALRVISRICRLAPTAGQSEYASFLDLWIGIYDEVEPIIAGADLSGCPHKVRVLDRVLWYLGETRFYDGEGSLSASAGISAKGRSD
jgi:hypothetical protein